VARSIVPSRAIPGLALLVFALAFGATERDDRPPRSDAKAGATAGNRDTGQEGAVPAPLVEREEVHFVSLDVVIERRAGGAWGRARDIIRDQIILRIGGRITELDAFENWCGSGSEEARGLDTGPAPAPVSGAPESSRAAAGGQASAGPADAAPHSYILYFDLGHLTLASRHAALGAAKDWAQHEAGPLDKVMIVTGGQTLRIIRPLLPSTLHFAEDLEKVKTDSQLPGMWADQEPVRIQEVDRAENPSSAIWSDHGTLGSGYTRVDYLKAATAIREMSDLMAILGSIEGPKSLILFEDTLRIVPGEEYGPRRELSDLQKPLQALADSANDRDVRIYPVQLGVMKQADSALTLLATETGGQYLDGTNRAATIFGKVAEDLSCFYRVGFRIGPGTPPRDARIEVRLRDDGGSYRVRSRRTLGLPTRAERAEGLVRTALLMPSTARAFPVRLTSTTMFRHARGARVRLQISVPAGDLLGLPASGHAPGSRGIDVEIGGQVVPLRAPAPAASGQPGAEHLALWDDVDPRKTPWAFGLRSVITVPPPAPDREPPRRIVQVEEIDLPPGAFRVVAVVHDQLAGTVAAGVEDLVIVEPPPILGDIHLFADDVQAVIVGDKPASTSGKTSRPTPEGKIGLASSSLRVQGIEPEDGVVQQGSALSLIYGVCRPDLTGSHLDRTITCAGSPDASPLPPPVIVRTEAEGSCVVVIDRPAVQGLGPGSCRFEVSVKEPDGGTTSRALSFTIAP